jgi:hypothetical protein
VAVYVVTGTTAYKGHQPGEEFEADLTPDEERRAKERGSIKAAKPAATTKKEKEADDA